MAVQEAFSTSRPLEEIALVVLRVVGGDGSWPHLGAARGAVKPWSVRTGEATRRAGLDGCWWRAVLRLSDRTDHHRTSAPAALRVGLPASGAQLLGDPAQRVDAPRPGLEASRH
jgi:hypothetical protein